MKNTSIKIIERLPRGAEELYSIIDNHAKRLECNYLIVGAKARDLVLAHGFNAKIERGTRDVDFGINVENWKQFFLLREKLLQSGFSEDGRVLHKLHYLASDGLPWEIDLVPFGAIEDTSANISWPPENDMVMCVLGFKEACLNAISVQISEEARIVIPVASPAGICLLKLVAWLDRVPEKRKKDAIDIKYLIDTYIKIPEINEVIYEPVTCPPY